MIVGDSTGLAAVSTGRGSARICSGRCRVAAHRAVGQLTVAPACHTGPERFSGGGGTDYANNVLDSWTRKLRWGAGSRSARLLVAGRRVCWRRCEWRRSSVRFRLGCWRAAHPSQNTVTLDHLCAIRKLLVVPAPERLDQLMAPNCRITNYVARWLARQRCTTDCRHPCTTDLVARCHVDQGSVTRVHRGLMGCLAARAKGLMRRCLQNI